MAAAELLRLWKLHKVDLAIVEIRKKAAALDPGRSIQAEIDSLQAEFEIKDGDAKRLSGEQHDIELRQKGDEEKIGRFTKELFGGKVVNSREVENLQKEIEMLKRHRGDLDERLLELWDLVPAAKAEAEALGARLERRRADLAEHRKRVVLVKEKLEAEFKVKTGERPALAAQVPKPLLDRYDRIRDKHDGIGMARISGRPSSCEMCGTLLPERLIEAAKEDRLAECESCHRILYWNEGVL